MVILLIRLVWTALGAVKGYSTVHLGTGSTFRVDELITTNGVFLSVLSRLEPEQGIYLQPRIRFGHTSDIISSQSNILAASRDLQDGCSKYRRRKAGTRWACLRKGLRLSAPSHSIRDLGPKVIRSKEAQSAITPSRCQPLCSSFYLLPASFHPFSRSMAICYA